MNLSVQPITAPPLGLPPGDPTFAGFQWFVQNSMAVPADAMPDVTWLQAAYDMALNLAYDGLAAIPSQPTSPSIYAMAVYNLGCAMLVQFAMDDPTADPPETFWTDLRNSFGTNAFIYGLINSAADQGTSEGTYILDQFRGMTLLDLQLAKTPWGRTYLMFAGEWGAIWGLTI